MKKILLIDDDQVLREIGAEILQRGGYAVICAEDGNRGVALFRSECPDLVITDIIMPEKEGIQTIIEIRSLRSDAKVIAMSGGGRRVGRTDFLKVARTIGAADVILKPLDPGELLARVGNCLAGG